MGVQGGNGQNLTFKWPKIALEINSLNQSLENIVCVPSCVNFYIKWATWCPKTQNGGLDMSISLTLGFLIYFRILKLFGVESLSPFWKLKGWGYIIC